MRCERRVERGKRCGREGVLGLAVGCLVAAGSVPRSRAGPASLAWAGLHSSHSSIKSRLELSPPAPTDTSPDQALPPPGSLPKQLLHISRTLTNKLVQQCASCATAQGACTRAPFPLGPLASPAPPHDPRLLLRRPAAVKPTLRTIPPVLAHANCITLIRSGHLTSCDADGYGSRVTDAQQGVR